MLLFSLFKKNKEEPVSNPVPVQSVKESNKYEFIVHCDENDKPLWKYQKENTDPDDIYNGMTMHDFKASGDCGEKLYKYPPLSVPVKLSAFIGEDGSVEISGYIIDGNDEILVGKAAKTKSKKILKILQENNPKITGELSGGYYWLIESSGYLNSDCFAEYRMDVSFEW